ncbi:MAG: ABC transporter ATP-binding protein [Bacillota bacterium]
MAQVILQHIVKEFQNGLIAVNDMNLEIKDKEFVVLVGPSGCGKSTTLRMVAGLEEITSGNIYIGDVLVNDIPPKDRDIAMVFQNYALYPHMDVFNNMAFGLKLRKVPKDEINRRVHETARILGIESLLDRKPKQLSGGQRQRVALGRAIVREPKVFLMDEPLSNLDAKLRVQMRGELIKLHSRLQTTIIYVTHDQTEAMTMGDRIVVMKDGIVQQVGEPLAIYDKPNNIFVAGFIGTPPMNFLNCVIKEEGNHLFAEMKTFKLPIPANRFKSISKYVDKEVILGIRPEHIQDKDFVSSPKAELTVEADVDVRELMGSEVWLWLSKGPDTLVAKVDAHTKAKDGASIALVLDNNKIHLFDKQTEQAII